MIAIRIVNVDYYMCYPVRELDVNYSEFRGTEVRQVPVIQIYGSSQTGHKTCVNIHGVFPYVYIPYDGTESAGNLSYKIAAELDKALNISLGQASANTCHIHNIVLVSGIPLYGYHERQHQFFKIYFYNPAIVKKACSLLENGAVLGKCFQPYESHINYILQFMMDYNLHGMSFVNISHVMYRTNPEDPDLLYDIPPHSILPNDIQRRTICKYEMDAQASSITNKEEISTGKLAVNPGIAALWEDEKQRRRNKQMDSQISFSLTQERNEIMSTATQIFFENKLSQILSRVSQQSDESSLDLNKSVYPAETPDDTELINASIADHTVLDTTLLDETIQESQTLSETLTESDVKLLEILRDLKETAHVEEDSLLSQRMQQEESESSNEDEQNYSLSLSKIVPDDDSIWENSFWDENCEIPQLDGIYDTDTNEDTNDSWQSDFNICNMDGMNAAIYENEPDTWITNVEELQNKYRNANDVYIEIENFDIPLGKKLNRGKNKLILTERISPTIPPTRQIKVLSDVCIKCAEYANNEFGDIEHRKTDYVIDNNYNHEISIDDFVTNEVIINDIALGNNSPKSLRDWEDVDIPSSLIMSDPGSRTQSRANSIDYFDETFFNEFEELNDSFGKENDSIEKKTNKSTKKKKGRKAVKKTLNFDKPNNKSKDLFQKKTIKKQPNGTKSLTYDNPHIESKDVLQKQTYQYYLREISNASFTKKKCKFCSGCCDVEVFPPNPKPKKKPAVRHESYPLKVSPAAYHVSNRLNILEHSKPEAFLDSIPTNINDTNNAELDEDLPLAQDSIPADINYTSNEICEELDENLLLTQNSIATDINYTSNEICEEINENLPLTQDSIPTNINYTSNEICEELDENLPRTQNSIPTDINYTSNEICEEINENLPLIQDSIPTDINYTSNDICEELNESLPQDSIPTDMNYTTNEICEEFDENLALAQYFPNTSLSSNDELSEQLATNCTIQSPKKDKIMETETNTNICTNNKVDKFTNEVHTDLNIVISITKTSIDEYNGVNNNEEQSLQYSATTNYTVDETQCVTKNENMFHIPTNYSSKEEIEFIKTKMLNWNLDGQADSPTSDSSSSIEEESSKKNITKKKNKNTASKSKSSTKKKTTCRTPGLIKPSVKKLKKTKRSNGSEIDSIEVKTESNKNNSIATEPMKKELKVVLLPLDLKTVEQKINKKSDALNTKSVTRNRKKSGKDNLCSSSLTDSSDIEQPGKKMKTEELNKAQILKKSENLNAKNKKITLTSSSDEEMRTKSFKNEIRMKRSVVHPRKHSNKIETFVRNTTDVQQSNNKINTEKSNSAAKMVICSSSSSDEVANTKKVKLSKLKTNRVKKNTLTTKKSIDKSLELSDKIPKNLNHTSNGNFKELDEKPFGQNILETNLSSNNSEGVSTPEKRIQTPVMNQKELIVSSNFYNGKTESSKMKDQNCIQIVTPRATRSSMRKENQNNSLSSDSSNNSQEKLSGSINNTKSDTLVEDSQKIILKSKILKEKSCISSDSSENTNKSSKIHQTANKKSEESNIHKEIASEEIIKKKLTNANEEKSPQQIQKEAQSTLFKNVVVRLERLASMDLMHTTITGINKNKDSPDTLNISPYSLKDDQQESSKTGNRNKLKHARNGTRNEKKSKINNANFANLNKSPTRGIKNKSNVLSPKYSPLNIIVRSPKKHSNLVQKENNSDYEPITKRLRTHSCVSGITPLNQNVNFKKKETENQKRSKGTGELQNIPVKQEGIQTHARNLKNIYIPTPQNCDIVKNELSTNTPDSIKKRLFNLENNNLNATVYEEFKTCSYENPSRKFSFSECPDINVEKDISYLRRLRQQEEFFLNNLDSHYSSKTNNPKQLTEEENSNIFDIELTNENRELDLSNKTTEQISTPVKLTNIKSKNQQNNTNFKSNNNQNNNETNENITSRRKTVKKKDKKPVSPIKFKDFDYFNINITPEKDKPDYSKNYYSPRETLSQQCEKELCNIDKYNTKIHNLTVAEKYDLKRDFAPQAGASGMSDEINRHMSPNYSFTYSNISFIDNSFMLNYSRSSQMGSQNLSISNEKTTKIWMPKYYPPSRQDIQNSLPDYNIPEYRFQQPFYSDYSDVTGKVDIGHNVLKIPSSTTADLAEFESSNDFCGIEKWRKEKFISLYPTVQLCKNFRTTLAGHSKMIITPVKPPPSRGDIVSWLKIKINGKEEKPVKKIDKPRIIIPLSPGNSNDSFNESMTLSPFTPEINSPPLTQNDIKSSQSTPVSSQESSSVIIKDKPRKKGNLQRKVLFSQSKQKSQEDEEKLKLLNLTESHSSNDSCQITGVTLDNTHGFQMSFENLQHAKALSEHQYLTILVVELHIRTRGELYPDPQYDSVRAIFYSILNDVPEDFSLPREETGVILVDTLTGSPVKQQTPILEGCGVKCKINYVKSEIQLIDVFIKLIRKWDPDIFVGFEIEMLSWGYLIERSSVLGINLPVQISRINPAIIKKKQNDNKQSEQELKLNGRIILDAWRLFRHEIALQSYTFENLMYHILHQRVPAHSFKDLSFWWEYRSNYFRHITANYYITRVEGILKLLDQLDLIGRTSELARLFGIQFYEVLSRGSQFRVESMMLRLAKPLNYIPVSPSVQQRAKMRAPEFIPLILEPESRFYTDPLIVLDFQSLYPSIIIAYNYCFSTCIGRVDKLGSNLPFDFGACQLKISKARVRKLQNKINFSPCGVGFVKPEVRQGILPRMLKEILETRLMVKSSMKENKDNKLLQRVLHNRQLGLKLIANVTYGYTSANFSGRMPCIEVGDSVVSKGRETLERAIKMIEQTERWRARVVYGDTDSLFVLVPGRSREEAFKIGAEIAEAVTNDNPPPVKLKLEKVYHPSLLQTKKRYVGYMYESPDQKEPEYNAKGIETVRRDGCPAVAKMLEKTLRLLFETRDMSLVKRYVCRQFEKLLTGRASIQDLVFAREYRGSSGYRPGACVPALELTRRWTATDKRREPRQGQRVPYVVVHGPPGLPIIRLVRCPTELLNPAQHSSLRPNAVYYITRVIAPPLNRCLSLIGADVQIWYNEMPRKQLQILPTDVHFENSKKSTISQYFATMSCVVCNNQTRDGLCENCYNNSQQTVVVLQEKLRQWERSFDDVKQICQSCCARVEYTDCVSLDCPVLYRLNQINRDLKQVPFVRNLIHKF